MASRFTRRRFLAASAAALRRPKVPAHRNANEKLNLAVIGVADRGAANLAGVRHENIAVLCDVDGGRLDHAKSQFPHARGFTDYRQFFDKIDKQIDAVVVSTPDHSHCLPASLAMTAGKPVYCEKPLAYSVAERGRCANWRWTASWSRKWERRFTRGRTIAGRWRSCSPGCSGR